MLHAPLKTFLSMSIVSTLVMHVVAEEEDIFDILIDISVGIDMAVCETSATCASYMKIISILFVILAIFICCQDPRACMKDFCTVRNCRRSTISLIAYDISRSK